MENKCFSTHLCQLPQITVHYSTVQQSAFLPSKESGKVFLMFAGRGGLLLLRGDFSIRSKQHYIHSPAYLSSTQKTEYETLT